MVEVGLPTTGTYALDRMTERVEGTARAPTKPKPRVLNTKQAIVLTKLGPNPRGVLEGRIGLGNVDDNYDARLKDRGFV
jgi:hypothetical protein